MIEPENVAEYISVVRLCYEKDQ